MKPNYLILTISFCLTISLGCRRSSPALELVPETSQASEASSDTPVEEQTDIAVQDTELEDTIDAPPETDIVIQESTPVKYVVSDNAVCGEGTALPSLSVLRAEIATLVAGSAAEDALGDNSFVIEDGTNSEFSGSYLYWYVSGEEIGLARARPRTDDPGYAVSVAAAAGSDIVPQLKANFLCSKNN
ncbi:hypothetical protein [Pseudobacteriovorax antillogorgiicola]|uniref:Lipoprotein n=1 Tax=Pseudobacteriovorax antillogorgiicola TaxID=1513793 RepID=A0A1Y6CJ40_9BACT|nr:hypothetical protein [Pseudobacteriovorax antillogorgiicola]TCS48287.1 hypothetical protein EDD56_11867 [Pseudobacteriovorax antillogorgiicola]SMF56910.1 hypothetical protein SAMN06296036_11874 [Pseudobacteriovorax antillogorgiicola]